MSRKGSLSGQIKGVPRKGTPPEPLPPNALLAFSCSLSLFFYREIKDIVKYLGETELHSDFKDEFHP